MLLSTVSCEAERERERERERESKRKLRKWIERVEERRTSYGGKKKK